MCGEAQLSCDVRSPMPIHFLSLSRSGLSEQRTKAVGHVNAGDDSSSEGSESEYVAGVAKVSAAGRPGQVGPSTRGT